MKIHSDSGGFHQMQHIASVNISVCMIAEQKSTKQIAALQQVTQVCFHSERHIRLEQDITFSQWECEILVFLPYVCTFNFQVDNTESFSNPISLCVQEIPAQTFINSPTVINPKILICNSSRIIVCVTRA